MAVGTHAIEVNGRVYRVRLGWNAVRRLEETLGLTIQQIGFRLINGAAGVRETGVVFWAGLETARLHDHSRPTPYSLEEVGDIIDEIGKDNFFGTVQDGLEKAFLEAWPIPKDPKAGDKDKEDPPPASTGAPTSPKPQE